jgi:hypothetical protein
MEWKTTTFRNVKRFQEGLLNNSIQNAYHKFWLHAPNGNRNQPTTAKWRSLAGPILLSNKKNHVTNRRCHCHSDQSEGDSLDFPAPSLLSSTPWNVLAVIPSEKQRKMILEFQDYELLLATYSMALGSSGLVMDSSSFMTLMYTFVTP